MKFLLIVLISIAGLQLQAQRPMEKQMDRSAMEGQKEEIKNERNERLNLTEKQIEQFDAINESYREQLKEERTNSRAERVERAKVLNEWRDSEIKNILDEEQYAEFIKMKDDRQDRMSKKRKRMRNERGERAPEGSKKYKSRSQGQ